MRNVLALLLPYSLALLLPSTYISYPFHKHNYTRIHTHSLVVSSYFQCVIRCIQCLLVVSKLFFDFASPKVKKKAFYSGKITTLPWLAAD